MVGLHSQPERNMATTETASSRYANIDDWSTAELVDGMLESQLAAVAAVHGARPAITRASTPSPIASAPAAA